MGNLGSLAVVFVALFIIVLAAGQMGKIFARIKLPLISGFLFAGIIAGPFILDFIHTEDISSFLLLDELALAFITFAAGAELELHVIQGYLHSIIAIISGQVVAVFTVGIVTFILIKDLIPFMNGLPQVEVVAIAILGATIMIARSPSSALAIIKELRARGPFTHKVLGATVLKDAVVIIIFAASVSVAAVLVEGEVFNVGLLLFVIFEILLDIVLGVLIGLLLNLIMKVPNNLLKSGLILLIGLSVFLISTTLHDFHLLSLPVGIFSEPLLICMTAGFYMANFTDRAKDFRHTVEEMSPVIFMVFFTLVGIELELDVIGEAWVIILILFAVRIVGIFIGSFAGTLAARDPGPGNALLGLGFITQAGVSVGLAKEIAVEFSEWGSELATLSIGVIVLNQIVGPPILKWAINRVGESHGRGATAEFDGIRNVVIFGLNRQSVQLALQLELHAWQVKLVYLHPEALQDMDVTQIDVHHISEISLDEMVGLELAQADAIVTFLPDEESYQLCELIYEEFGISTMVALLDDRVNFDRFYELGVNVVEPQTAVVSLLEHFVRAPVGASLLLGMDGVQDVVDIKLRTPDLNNIRIRDLNLPLDVLILSLSRNNQTIISHGYTKLRVGDKVTIVGPEEKLAEVMARFDG